MTLQAVPDTGEVSEDAPSYGDLVNQNKKLKDYLAGAAGTIGKLEKQLKTLRGVEPDAQKVTEVLEFWREVTGHRKADIDPGGKRAEKVRWLLRRPKWNVERLKRVVVGVTRSSYHQGQNEDSRVYDDAVTIFRDEEIAERLEKCAEQRTDRLPRNKLTSSLSPLEHAAAALAREFGANTVDLSCFDEGDEAWGPCPLHPGHPPQKSLRIAESGRRGSLTFACLDSCDPAEIHESLRALYGIQATRDPGEEIADLRVQVEELRRALFLYASPEWWKRDANHHAFLDKDAGNMARQALGLDEAA